MNALAALAILPAGATLYFYVFWRAFDFWRAHVISAYAMMLGTFAVLGAAMWIFHAQVFAGAIGMPVAAQVAGWVLIGVSCAFGTVADRQLGLWVRAFVPFFTANEKIRLRTTGAYAVVRHPIYASGIWFQLGAFLVSGRPAVLVSCGIFTAGCFWFTRREEERLVTRLEDPSAYQRYRARVPALFPWPRP